MESSVAPQAHHHFKRRLSAGLIVAGGLAIGLTAPSWTSSQAHAQADVHEDPATGNRAATPGTTDGHVTTLTVAPNMAGTATKTAPVSAVKQAAGSPSGPSTREYRVLPNDTLSDIAVTQLGEASRYREIFDLNKGKPQHDGGSLSDPDVIQVGWTLELPVDAAPNHRGSLRAAPQAYSAVNNGATSAVTAAMTTPASSTHAATSTHRPMRKTGHTTIAVSGSPRQIARSIVPSGQFGCFSEIISHESGWDIHATNPSSGAYGLPQSLPGSKMASAGPNWRDDAATQIKWALDYMNSRYGSPCDAWSFWQGHNWY